MTSGIPRGHRHEWRDWVVPALIVTATALLLVGCLTVWVRRQALDTPYVVRAGDQMLEDPQIRSQVALYLVDQLYARVDVEAEISRLLPARERMLAGPAAGALRQSAPRAVDAFLATPLVVRSWEAAVRQAHQVFLRIVNGSSTTDLQVYLGLRPILLELAARFGVEQQVAARLPADAARLPLFREHQIGTARRAIAVLKSVSVYGLLLVLALYGLAIGLARGHRRRTLLRIGLAILLAGTVILLIRPLAGSALVNSLIGSRPTLEPAGMNVWRILTRPLSSVGWMVVAIGAVATAFAALAGPSRAATALRTALAPVLAPRPAAAWAIGGLAIVTVLLTVPAIDGPRLIGRSVLIVEVVGGTEMVRRIALAEYGTQA